MSRVTKETALNLIKYARKVEVNCNYWDPYATSALEFARQMNSPKFKKANSNFSAILNLHQREEPGRVIAEFSDNQIWETVTSEYKASELRSAFFMFARMAETAAEMRGETDIGDDMGDSKGGKGGGGAKSSPPSGGAGKAKK